MRTILLAPTRLLLRIVILAGQVFTTLNSTRWYALNGTWCAGTSSLVQRAGSSAPVCTSMAPSVRCRGSRCQKRLPTHAVARLRRGLRRRLPDPGASPAWCQQPVLCHVTPCDRAGATRPATFLTASSLRKFYRCFRSTPRCPAAPFRRQLGNIMGQGGRWCGTLPAGPCLCKSPCIF